VLEADDDDDEDDDDNAILAALDLNKMARYVL
jgi:hypothetical protein